MLLAKLLKLSGIIDNTMNLPPIVGLGIKIRYSGLSNETAYGDMLCLGPFPFIAVRLRLPPHLLLPRPLFLSLLDFIYGDVNYMIQFCTAEFQQPTLQNF